MRDQLRSLSRGEDPLHPVVDTESKKRWNSVSSVALLVRRDTFTPPGRSAFRLASLCATLARSCDERDYLLSNSIMDVLNAIFQILLWLHYAEASFGWKMSQSQCQRFETRRMYRVVHFRKGLIVRVVDTHMHYEDCVRTAVALYAGFAEDNESGVGTASPPSQRNQTIAWREHLSGPEGTFHHENPVDTCADVQTKRMACETACIIWRPEPTLPVPSLHIMASTSAL